MSNNMNIISDFLDSLELKYEFKEDKNIFLLSMTMDNSVGTLNTIIRVRENSYIVYTVLNNHVGKSSIGRVAEFLHRANYVISNGNFELDYSDGEIRYKTFVNTKGINLSTEIVKDSIMVHYSVFKLYGDELMKVMFSNIKPELAIKNAEDLMT